MGNIIQRGIVTAAWVPRDDAHSNEIIPSIFVSDHLSGSRTDIPNLYVVEVRMNQLQRAHYIAYLQVPLNDASNLLGGKDQQPPGSCIFPHHGQIFFDALEFITEVYDACYNVLIHCQL